MASTQDEILKVLKKIAEKINQRTVETTEKAEGDELPNVQENEGPQPKGLVKNMRAYNANKDEAKRARTEYNGLVSKYNKLLEAGNKAEAQKTYREVEKARAQMEAAERALAENTTNVSKSLSTVGTAATSISDVVFKVLKANIDKQRARLNAAFDLQKREMEVYGNIIGDAAKVMMGNVTGTIISTAYQSLNATMEGGRRFYMKGLQDQLTMKRMNTQIANINRDISADIAGTALNTISGIAGMLGPYGMIIGKVLSMGADVTRKTLEYTKTKAEFELELQEKVVEATDGYIAQMHSAVAPFKDISEKVTRNFYDLSNETYRYGRTMGLNRDQLRTYTDAVIRTNLALSQVGLSYKDYVKMQANYNAQNGRMGVISDNEALLMGGLGLRLGIGADEVANITGAMQMFNISIDSGTEMMYKLSNTASKMGLSATKFAKDLEKNLKLAERYQFKGGVRGLMDMALQAQKIRFNMDELSGVLSKIQTGNIEDVIKTSAQLNVLGGNAALMSDPMAMLYNAYADPKQYMENINRMVQGFGTYDKKTGETTFSIPETMRMDAIAAATGVSRENLMNQVRQQNKEKVLRQRYGNRLGKNADAIFQNATVNEAGEWIIKVADSSKKGGFREETVEAALANPRLLDNIFPEDKQDTLIEYVRAIKDRLAPEEQQKNVELYTQAKILDNQEVVDKLYSTSEELVEERYKNINENLVKYQDALKATSDATVEAQRIMNSLIAQDGIFELYKTLLKEDNDQMRQFANDFKAGASIFHEIVETFIKSGYKGLDKKVQEMLSEFEAINRFSSPGMAEKVKDNTLTREEIEKMSPDELDEFVKNYRVKNLSSLQQKEMMKNGSIGFYNGRMVDYQGNILHMKDNAINADVQNKEWEASGKKTRFSRTSANTTTIHWGDAIYANVKEVDDLIISPKHGVFETHPEDTIIAKRPGGAIEKAEQKVKENMYMGDTLNNYFGAMYPDNRVINNKTVYSSDNLAKNMIQKNDNGFAPKDHYAETYFSDMLRGIKALKGSPLDKDLFNDFVFSQKNNGVRLQRIETAFDFSTMSMLRDRLSELSNSAPSAEPKRFMPMAERGDTAKQEPYTAYMPVSDRAVLNPAERQENVSNTRIPGEVLIRVDGNLKLDANGVNIDIMDSLRNDPNALRELTKEIIVEGSRTVFGGKHIHAPKRYTF